MTTRPSNPDHPHPASDREALSALFDGELSGDTARFVLKRLDLDQDWRATCERWQSVADVLRKRGTALPSSFASRIRDAVHADAHAHALASGARAPVAQDRTRTGGLRWSSVALAASAAVVAFFLARSPVVAPDAPVAPAQLATTHAAPVAPKSPVPTTQAPESPAADLESATAAVAVAAIARPVHRNRNVQRDRAATDRVVSSAVARSEVTGEAPMVSEPVNEDIALDAPAEATHPSSPFTGTAAGDARPWPRAVLPQYRSGRGGALVADYATAPTFYPFVPRTTQSQPANENGNAPAGTAATHPQSPPP